MNIDALEEAIKTAEKNEEIAYKEWQSKVDATAEAKRSLAWHKHGLKPGDRVECKIGKSWVPAKAHSFCKNGWWLHIRRILKDGSVSDSVVNAYSQWRKV
ncbi:MAG TPA: hypothetical protein PKO15_12765 [Fibrobacteria bacterium]|mgnify:CR=1 FL=1|nr:hypothetical protein [Fibrobacteria bacterium]